MKDNYLRTTEEYEASLSGELRTTYPDLVFGRFEYVRNPLNSILVDDISYKIPDPRARRLVDDMEFACNGGLEVRSLTNLTEVMTDLMSSTVNSFNPESTLVVYPGNGAQTVKDILAGSNLAAFPSISVPASRVKDESGEVVGISLPWEEKPTLDGIENVIVVDDVINSGKSLIALKEKVGLSDTKWFGAAPVMFSPLVYEGRTGFPSSIPGYERIFASLVLQGVRNPVILDTLSEFIGQDEKSVRLMVRNTHLYISNSNDFARFVSSIVNLRRTLDYYNQK